jgi:hypothetical protein
MHVLFLLLYKKIVSEKQYSKNLFSIFIIIGIIYKNMHEEERRKTKLIKLVPLLYIDNLSGQIYKIYGLINT